MSGFFGRPTVLRAQRLEEVESSLRPPRRTLAALAPAPEPSARTTLLGPLAWPLAIYGASRLLVLALAGAVSLVTHHGLSGELSVFDGQWYLRLASKGYPTLPLHRQSTLGFLPLYPLVFKALAYLARLPLTGAALLTSLLGGAASTVLVQRLATTWWGELTGRRAALIFVLFPGSVVFSLVYSEGLTIPLALGCLLALRSSRFALAGLCAGLATAVEPAALVLIPVCAYASFTELRERGLADQRARASLLAPLLAPLGLAAFACYLWAWTGSPFASLAAQHYGWYQQSEPLGVLGLPVVRHLISHPPDVFSYLPSWNLWNGIGGAVFLALSLVGLYRSRRELSRGVLVWTAGLGLLTFWSVMTPPNARMLLLAAPAVVIWARRLSSRRLPLFIGGEIALFCFMTALTLSGHMLP